MYLGQSDIASPEWLNGGKVPLVEICCGAGRAIDGKVVAFEFGLPSVTRVMNFVVLPRPPLAGVQIFRPTGDSQILAHGRSSARAGTRPVLSCLCR